MIIKICVFPSDPLELLKLAIVIWHIQVSSVPETENSVMQIINKLLLIFYVDLYP